MLDCDQLIFEFELQSHSYVLFQINIFKKNIKPLNLPAISEIVPLGVFNDIQDARVYKTHANFSRVNQETKKKYLY